jgi:anti-sigma B factor antagonist
MTFMQTARQDDRVSIRVDKVQRGDVLTIRLSGELDCATQSATRNALKDNCGGHLPPRLIIDLTQLDFCDCAGARVLSDLQQAAEEQNVSCVIKDPQPQVRWVLRVVGIAV